MTTHTIHVHPADTVVIARRQVLGGAAISDESITVAGLAPIDQKVAAKSIVAEALRLGVDSLWSEFERCVVHERAIDGAA